MKNKGFTLVELLAVIVILGLLALIVVPNIAGVLKNQKKSLYEVQIKNIEEAAKGWASENFSSLPENPNETKTIYLKDLAGFIDIEIENPNSGNMISPCLRINITKVGGTDNYTYRVDEDTISADSTSCY